MASSSTDDDFSVLVLASDLGIDARPFLAHEERQQAQDQDPENWHDCAQFFVSDEDFSDLDALQFFRFEGSDKLGNRILRIVGKCFPAQVVSGERLKKYIFHKICTELPDGPFCIVYMHSTVQKEDNSPGITILRWIYEELPAFYKDRLQVVYFIHPGIRSRLAIATLGRFFLSGGLYWKIKYVSRLQYLWDDIKKGEIEIPEFVQNHDNVLENRPLVDYGIEPDPYHMNEITSSAYSLGRCEQRWMRGEDVLNSDVRKIEQMGCRESKNVDKDAKDSHVITRRSKKGVETVKRTSTRRNTEMSGEGIDGHVPVGENGEQELSLKKEKLFTIEENESEDDESFYTSDDQIPSPKNED